ncbi:MAG TPA: DUF58 domain-containing protein [Caulobacterales bacterium]|nr:DUF58 domain-containing protein [Caulobacterales bacterium]
MIAPTARAIVLAALGAPISLLLAALAPRLWPLGAAWAITMLALILVDAALAVSGGRLKVEAQTPRLAGVGAGAFPANILLAFGRRGPRNTEVVLETNALIDAAPNRRVAATAGGEGATAFELEPRRRGEAKIERAFLRWRGPMGLAWRQRTQPLDTRIAVAPDLGAIEREAQKLFSRTMVHGLKPMRDRGDGSEFDALAEFQPGMDKRLLDWKQSARHRKLLAKEVRAERNHQIVFAIDTGRVMCEPVQGVARVDWALNAALMLSYVSLKLGDRVSFFGFDARPHLATGFVSGAGAFTQLKALTARLDYSTEETNYTLGLATLAERLQRRSMIVVFTDFADTISAELMLENMQRLMRRHMVVFVAFRDEELESLQNAAPESSDDVTRAVIAHQLLRERSIVLARLRRMGAHIVTAPVQRLGSELVRAYDRLRRAERI